MFKFAPVSHNLYRITSGDDHIIVFAHSNLFQDTAYCLSHVATFCNNPRNVSSSLHYFSDLSNTQVALVYINILCYAGLMVQKYDKTFLKSVRYKNLAWLYVYLKSAKCACLFLLLSISVYISGRPGQFASDTSCYLISPRGSPPKAVLPYIGRGRGTLTVHINSILFVAFSCSGFCLSLISSIPPFR